MSLRKYNTYYCRDELNSILYYFTVEEVINNAIKTFSPIMFLFYYLSPVAVELFLIKIGRVVLINSTYITDEAIEVVRIFPFVCFIGVVLAIVAIAVVYIIYMIIVFYDFIKFWSNNQKAPIMSVNHNQAKKLVETIPNFQCGVFEAKFEGYRKKYGEIRILGYCLDKENLFKPTFLEFVYLFTKKECCCVENVLKDIAERVGLKIFQTKEEKKTFNEITYKNSQLGLEKLNKIIKDMGDKANQQINQANEEMQKVGKQ